MAAVHPMLFNRLATKSATTTTTTEITPFLSILQKMNPEEVQRFIDMVRDCHRVPNITHSQLVPGQFFNGNLLFEKIFSIVFGIDTKTDN